MAKNTGRPTSTTATASTPEGELNRHLRVLGLPSAEAYRIWCREHGFRAGLEKTWQERRQEAERAKQLAARQAQRNALHDHFRQLQLDGEEAYRKWCRASGFPETLDKRPEQLRQELDARRRESSELALRSARRLDRRPEEFIRAAAAGAIDSRQLKAPHLRALHAAFASLDGRPGVREALVRLLVCAQKSTRLISADPAIASLGPQPSNTYIAGMTALASRFDQWIRSPEDWQVGSHSAKRQFTSLARHLFCYYETPEFLDAAWFEPTAGRAAQHQDWFLHIGMGANIRTASIPIALTKRAAHLFLQAPGELAIEAALRWAQVQALGGDMALVRSLLATRLAEVQQDEPFWQSVVFFFINNPMLDPARTHAIVDYIHNRRFEPSDILDAGGEVIGHAIPEPEFSMKGRTGLALLRRVDEWHQELARDRRRPATTWEPCGIEGLEWSHYDPGTKTQTVWTIEEIRSMRRLQEEGRAMRHCVASYSASCVRGSASIWSLQAREQEGTARRVMTIELNNARRTIVQARGRMNKSPGEKRASHRLNLAPDVVRRWAELRKLCLAPHVFEH